MKINDLFRNISLEEVIPPQYRSLFNGSEPILFYRINTISIAERHAVINAQLEWNETAMFGTRDAFAANGTDIELEWDTDERVAVWIDDAAINEMLDQVVFTLFLRIFVHSRTRHTRVDKLESSAHNSHIRIL